MSTDNVDNKGDKSWTMSGALKWTFMGLAGCLFAHTVISAAGLWGVSEVAAKGITTAFNMAVDGYNPVNAISPTLG